MFASGFLRKQRTSCLYSHIRTVHKYIPRRAVLYIPGNDERKIKKIATLNVDCAVLDCEDGVAINKKVCTLNRKKSLPNVKSNYKKNQLLYSYFSVVEKVLNG